MDVVVEHPTGRVSPASANRPNIAEAMVLLIVPMLMGNLFRRVVYSMGSSVRMPVPMAVFITVHTATLAALDTGA
jgi:hypothetical protein